MKNYEIWDSDSGNLLIDRPTRDEALAVVREAIDRHGVGYADSLTLLFEDSEDEIHVIAEGKALAELALRSGLRVARPRVKQTAQPVVSSEVVTTFTRRTRDRGVFAPGQRSPVSGQYKVPGHSNERTFVKRDVKSGTIVHGKKSVPTIPGKKNNKTEPS